MKTTLWNQKGWIIGAVLTCLLAVSAAPLFAEEEKPTGNLTVGVLSKYIWRGYESSRNSIVIQPSITIGYKGFAVNLWGNLDTRPYYGGTGNVGYGSSWNETDLTLSYSKTIGLFNVGGGYIYYGLGALNQDAADRLDSQEIFVTAGLNTLLSPTLTIYKEIDHYHQWYVLLGVSHTLELSKTVSLQLAASAGYLKSEDAGTYPKFDDAGAATADKFSGFHDGLLSVSLPVKVSPYVTLTPSVSYSFPLSDAAKNEIKGLGMSGAAPSDRDSAFLYGGVTASLAF